jgi:hypothetical protein
VELVLDDQRVVAVWAQCDLQAGMRLEKIHAACGTLSGAFKPSILLEQSDTGASRNPEVALSATGHAMAAWHRMDGTMVPLPQPTHAVVIEISRTKWRTCRQGKFCGYQVAWS